MNNNTSKRYRNEILEGFSLSNYESTFHKVEKANSQQIIEQALKEYGLAEGLNQARARQRKLSFVDVGCSEGLFLHDLADTLEQHGLLEAADLNGVDVDSSAIATAEEFARLVKPPRPYLNFYVHKLGYPFSQCNALAAEGKLQFDFIAIRRKLEYLPGARQRFEQLYQALKPGGVIYLRSLLSTSTDDGGSVILHSALEPFYMFIREYLANLNKGILVATALPIWLQEIGAVQVQVKPDLVPVGGATERGRNYLRNTLIFMENFAPKLIELGRMTPAQYQAGRQQLFSEVTSDRQGQITFVDVLAKKPL